MRTTSFKKAHNDPLDEKLAYSRNLYLRCGEDPLKFLKAFFPKAFELPFSSMHRDFADVYMNDDIKKFAGLAPRGYGKSELVVFGFSTHASIYHPEVSRGGVQVICSETEDTAIDRVETILQEIKTNKVLRQFYGNLQGKKTQAKQIDIYNEKMDVNSKIFARGRGQQFQGLKKGHARPYFEFFDDFESRDECRDAEMVNRSLQWIVRVPEQALAKNGRQFMVATLMAPESATHKISKLPDWYTLLYSAIKPDGSMLWKEHMGYDALRKKQEAFINIGDEQGFWLEFMNVPVNPENREISYKHINYFEPKAIKKTVLNNYIIIDPSFSSKKGSDITGIIVAGIDDIGNIYFHDAVYSSAKDPKSIVEEIFPFIKLYKPMGVYVESFGAQRIMVSTIGDILKKEKVFAPVMGVRGEYTAGAKIVRIRNFISKIKTGALYGGKKNHKDEIIPEILFNAESRSIKLMIRDILMFPDKAGGGDFDVIDAGSYIHKIAVRPHVFRENARKSDWDEIIEDIRRTYGKDQEDVIYKML